MRCNKARVILGSWEEVEVDVREFVTGSEPSSSFRQVSVEVVSSGVEPTEACLLNEFENLWDVAEFRA